MTIINKIIGVIFSLFLVFIFIVKINGLQSESLKIVALTLLFVAIVVVAIRFYYNKLISWILNKEVIHIKSITSFKSF